MLCSPGKLPFGESLFVSVSHPFAGADDNGDNEYDDEDNDEATVFANSVQSALYTATSIGPTAFQFSYSTCRA